MGGDGVAPSLHVCMSAAALTCSLSVPESGRAGRLMRCFFSLSRSLTCLSCPPEEGGWGGGEQGMTGWLFTLPFIFAFQFCRFPLSPPTIFLQSSVHSAACEKPVPNGPYQHSHCRETEACHQAILKKKPVGRERGRKPLIFILCAPTRALRSACDAFLRTLL